LCIIAYFLAKEFKDEAISCTVIFILSIFYIVMSYKAVNDVGATKIDG